MKAGVILIFVLLAAACADRNQRVSNMAAAPGLDSRASELTRTRDALEPFFEPMVVHEGDWLDAHPEDGETFEQYIGSKPTLPTAERKTIYIQPIGKFSSDELSIIELTAEYMRAFYDLPVVIRKAQPIDGVTPEVVRVQYPNNLQILTSYFVDHLLPKMLPDDAAALICFTSNDLFPGPTWNYVFGQASLEKRVGAWSLYRLGKNNGKPANKDLFLARTLKIAMHETGHMFSMRHCTKYECLMSGTNHLDETDRRPLDTCPECTAKLSWAMNYPAVERYRKLAKFWHDRGNTDEEQRMLERAKAVSASNKKDSAL